MLKETDSEYCETVFKQDTLWSCHKIFKKMTDSREYRRARKGIE